MTGIGTDELRARAADRALLSALLRFLEAHEPDLLWVAGEMDIDPNALVAARRALEGEEEE